MKLHFRQLGEGKPLIILHGVFGSSDNLFTVSRKIAEQGFEVFILDARNHGQSPRSDVFDYVSMAADLNEFLEDHQIEQPFILGHSMGGKTVIQYSQHYDNFSGLIVVDIAARQYPQHHGHILAGLKAINLEKLTSRKEAEEIFGQYVTDFGERQFILKNLYRNESDGFDWRINLPILDKNSGNVVAEIPLIKHVEKPLLVMRGSESDYVKDTDFEQLKQYYYNARLVTIAEANHWIHATQPTEFVKEVIHFLN